MLCVEFVVQIKHGIISTMLVVFSSSLVTVAIMKNVRENVLFISSFLLDNLGIIEEFLMLDV